MKKNNKGFTLIETAFVLGISGFIGFIAFSQILKQEEFNRAGMAGNQIKLIGDATNAYITNHYDTLSTLSNSTGSTSDVGPRTCFNSSNSCTITSKTLINEGLLPASFTGKNVYGQGYDIVLKRSGSSPYYKIYGIVTTDNSLMTGTTIRYDLLGKAMQKAGIDSGMTRNSSSQVSGFNGAWIANATDYNNINKLGQLAYQTGYGTYNYSVFLRRDGTLPMTGNLNMGANSINNVVDYQGTGNLSTDGTITAGAEVFAHNGYGDTIALGGDAAGNDYEIRLNSPKPLSIFSPNLAAADRPTTTVLKTNGQMQVIGNQLVNNSLATNGYLPTDMPAGWSGIRTADFVGSGTLAVLKNGTTGAANDKAFYATQYGNMFASNSITSGGWVWGTNGYGNQIGFGGDGSANDYEIKMMTDEPLSIHMNSNRSDLTALKVTGGISASGNIQTSGNIQFLNSVSAGTACASNGLLNRDNSGQILSCQSGIWMPEQPVGIPQPWPSTTPPSGWLICNGQSFNTSTYPLLAKAYPNGVLPDLRGSFIRGLDQGKGIDSGRGILTQQRASVVTGTDDNWSDNDVGVLHGPSSLYSRDSINVYDYTTGSNGQDPKYWVHFGGGTGPANGSTQTLDAAADLKLSNNGSNGFYGGARPYNTSFVYIVRAM